MLRQDEQNNMIAGEVEIVDEFGTISKLAVYDDLGDAAQSDINASSSERDPPAFQFYSRPIVPDASTMVSISQNSPVKGEIEIFQDEEDLSSSSPGQSMSQFSRSLVSWSFSPSSSRKSSCSQSPSRAGIWADQVKM